MISVSKRFRIPVSLLGLLALAAFAPLSAARASAFVDAGLKNATGKVRVIVLFKDRVALPRTERSLTTYSTVRRALEVNSAKSQRAVAELLRSQSALENIRFRSLWIVNGMLVEIPAAKIALLQNHPDVRAIYKTRTKHLISDFRGTPVHRLDPFTYGLSIMGIPQLREESPKSNGEGVRVGILDTGVDATHPDLNGKVVGFKDFIGGKTEPYDDHGHGTHVAGTIAGGDTSGTSIGIAPSAKIISAKVFDASGSSEDDTLLAAMEWIADPDGKPETHDQPALVSNSWGGGRPSPTADPADDVFCEALSTWLKLGIFPVFAAGNEGPRNGTVGSPGACPQAYAIGATDDHDVIAKFSSRGPTTWKTGVLNRPNVSAPGVSILSAKPGGGYQSMSGTSMATPHAAGLLALIYQTMPTITIDDAAKIVSATSKDLGTAGPDTDFGAGRIDALAAIHAAKTFRARHGR